MYNGIIVKSALVAVKPLPHHAQLVAIFHVEILKSSLLLAPFARSPRTNELFHETHKHEVVRLRARHVAVHRIVSFSVCPTYPCQILRDGRACSGRSLLATTQRLLFLYMLSLSSVALSACVCERPHVSLARRAAHGLPKTWAARRMISKSSATSTKLPLVLQLLPLEVIAYDRTPFSPGPSRG